MTDTSPKITEAIHRGLAHTKERPTSLCEDAPFQSYDNQVSMNPPDRSKLRGPIGVDLCLASEIAALWAQGIRTIECCCGHGRQVGYIAVGGAFVQRMLGLGYVQQERRGFFYPKTGCSNVMANEAVIVAQTARLTELEAAYESATSLLDEYGDRITKLEAEHVRLHTDYGTLYAKNDALEDEVAELRGDNKALRGHLEKVTECRIATLADRLARSAARAYIDAGHQKPLKIEDDNPCEVCGKLDQEWASASDEIGTSNAESLREFRETTGHWPICKSAALATGHPEGGQTDE